MKWKQWLFGNIHYYNQTEDGKQSFQFKLKGGIIPNVLFWGGLIALVWYLVHR